MSDFSSSSGKFLQFLSLPEIVTSGQLGRRPIAFRGLEEVHFDHAAANQGLEETFQGARSQLPEAKVVPGRRWAVASRGQ